jgi:hypothetical protein
MTDHDYAPAWARLRRVMRIERILVVVLIPMILVAHVLERWLLPDRGAGAGAVIVGIWLVVWFHYTSALLGFECPRCGELFFGRGLHLWRTHCTECDLKKYAE